MSWQETYAHNQLTPDEAVQRIKRGKHIQVSSGASVPTALVEALGRNSAHFADNTIVHLMTFGDAPHVDPKFEGRFRHNAFFIGPNVRKAVHEGRADYTPVFLSRIPSLIRTRRMPVDVALIQCSPPDPYGFVNLGVSVDISLAGIASADLVIAEVNPNVPIVHGAGFVPMKRFDHWVWSEAPLKTHDAPEPDEVSLEIGRHVATLIEDRSTLQLGIGAIPDALIAQLSGRTDLGVHSEMISDGVMEAVDAGIITGTRKSRQRRKVVTTFILGSRKLYDWVHENPRVEAHPCDYTNDLVVAADNDRLVAINSALSIDITGQVNADSVGSRIYSGFGGQLDFIRAAARSKDGVPIIAFPSTAQGGTVSRIVPLLKHGAGVVTTRADVHWVVTEFGAVNLFGKSLDERRALLASIAHPSFRDELLG